MSDSANLKLLLLIFIAVACSCGPVEPEPCGPSNCAGCCGDQGLCYQNGGTAFCGTEGDVCRQCASNERCTFGVCLR